MRSFTVVFTRVVLLCVLLQPLTAQQWERLPLNGGQLDGLVQNPYNEKEILAYARWYHLYLSHDGGLTWKTIEHEPLPFDLDFNDITFDPLSRIYVVTKNGVWRSADQGRHWSLLDAPNGNRYFLSSRVRISIDGTIVISNTINYSLLVSSDDGASWKDIRPPGKSYVYTLYLHSSNPDIILLRKLNSTVRTFDGGKTWAEFDLPATCRSPYISFIRDEKLVLRAFTGREDVLLYESTDTARTWKPVSVDTVRVRGYDCERFGIEGKIFCFRDSIIFMQPCYVPLRSTDAGKTFTQLSETQYIDVVQVGEELIALHPMLGVQRSTDYGDTWMPVLGQPEVLRFGDIEYAHAFDDTMFVLASDRQGESERTSYLLESDDGGFTWYTLFETGSAYDLQVDAGPAARYYLHARVPGGLYALLSGVAGQSPPDTVLLTTSIARPTDIHPPRTFRCIPSERFPGWVYAAKHNSTIGWSSDHGSVWHWSSVPISISAVAPWPSQLDPLRVLVTAHEGDALQNGYAGLYLTEDGGGSFQYVNNDEKLGAFAFWKLFVTQEDRLFLRYPSDSSSTDHGRTWAKFRTGLPDQALTVQKYQSHGKVLTETDTGLYIVDGDAWRLLRDPHGVSVWTKEMHEMTGSKTIYMDLAEKYLYVLIPVHGLYRIAVDRTTGVEIREQPSTSDFPFYIYPNPAHDFVTFRWREDALDSGLLQIYDLFGRLVWEASQVTGANVAAWNPQDHLVPGVYVARMSVNDKVLCKMFILR